MLNWWNHTPPPQRLAVLMSIGRWVCIVFGDELCGTAQLVKKVAYLLGAMTPKLSASGLPKEIRYITWYMVYHQGELFDTVLPGVDCIVNCEM